MTGGGAGAVYVNGVDGVQVWRMKVTPRRTFRQTRLRMSQPRSTMTMRVWFCINGAEAAEGLRRLECEAVDGVAHFGAEAADGASRISVRRRCRWSRASRSGGCRWTRASRRFRMDSWPSFKGSQPQGYLLYDAFDAADAVGVGGHGPS